MKKDVYAVLLAGGKGTRLWPLSTEDYSKPFIRFGKRKTLIEDAIDRMHGIVGKKNILIVIDKAKANLLKKIHKQNVLIEPFGRNTASAVGLAAINLKPESLMLVMPTDNLIEKLGNFRNTMKVALSFVKNQKDVLLCIGTVPRSASSSFGHIKIAKNVKGNIFSVDKFIEKPSLNKAKKFLRNPNYLWNAGIFIFKAKTILNAIKKHAPNLNRLLQRIKKNKLSIKSAYSKMKNISIDYQIMEKAKNLYCVKGDFAWQDIGNWASLGNLFKKNKKGNVCVGKASLVDVKNSVLYNSGKSAIGAIGLRGVVVVQTENGTLVCSKKDVEKVKELVKKIRN